MMEVRVEGQPTPVLLSPLQWAVTVDGRIVPATPLGSLYLGISAMLLVSMMAGSVFAWTYRGIQDDHHGMGYRTPYLTQVRLAVSLGLFGWLWWTWLPDTKIVLVLLAVLVICVGMDFVRSLRLVGWTCVAMAAILVPQVELASPYPPLANAYGLMGIHVWDMVSMALPVAAFFVWRISRLRLGATVYVTAPPSPLVQDVRIVDRR
jgi:hypothetical protein